MLSHILIYTILFVAIISILINSLLFNEDGVRSVTAQSIHYFGRPHSTIPFEPITSNANWTAIDLLNRKSEWCFNLTEYDIDDLYINIQHFQKLNIPLHEMKLIDFPMISLQQKIHIWKKNLNEKIGLGLVVIKNVPVDVWSETQCEIFWWGLGLHLGIPGVQNGKGDILGHVKNEFIHISQQNNHNNKLPSLFDSNIDDIEYNNIRQYRTNEAILYHCDLADVVGLLCIKNASSGGISRIASSIAVYNELLRRLSPSSISLLFQKIPLDTRGEGGVNWIYVQPITYHDSVLRTFWHTEYFLSAYRYSDSIASNISFELYKVIKVYDEIANSPMYTYEMTFERGDIQLISNHVV